MSTPDPTAPRPVITSYTREQLADKRSRAMALALACVTALLLLPAIVVTLLTGNWSVLLVGFLGWFAVMLICSGIVTYRYGPTRRS